MNSKEPDQDGLYNPIPATETEYVQEAIERNTRLRSVSLKLAEKYRADAALFTEYAENWEQQARICSYFLLKAYKRSWALEDSGQWTI